MKQPPEKPPRWDLSPSTFKETVERLTKASTAVWDHVASIKPEHAGFESAILPIIHNEQARETESKIFDFVHTVSPLKEVRDAAREASKAISRAVLGLETRTDVFLVVQAVVAKGEPLDIESKLYLERLYDRFVMGGAKLEHEHDRQRLETIHSRLVELRQKYIGNINQDKNGIWLSAEELKGVPGHHLDRWKADGPEERDGHGPDEVWINFKRPNLWPVLQYAANEDVRRRVFTSSENRLKEINEPLLRETLLLKDEAARLLGYKNHAESKAKDRMLDPATAKQFLSGLREKLTPKGKAELATFKNFKKEEHGHQGSGVLEAPDSDQSSEIFLWDRQYYDRLAKAKSLVLDQDLVAEYFPFHLIVPKMLDIYEALFGLQFVKCPVNVEEGSAWHDDVTLYAVWDDENEGGGFLGYLYIDPFPRPNKYTHFGTYRLSVGFDKPSGERHYPSAVFVANYTPPGPVKPSLMRHAEVVNCFHELGHAIANILCRRQYSGSAKLAPDFTEVPSIFLEYFFWDPNIIRALSSHYTDPTGQSRIPDDLIEHLIEARDFNAALQPLVLLAQSLFDLEIHSPPNAETLKSMNLAVTFNTIRKEVLMLKGPEDLGYGYEALHGYSHFRAIIGNYDACYYTYLTSRAYASDMFETVFEPIKTKTSTVKLDEIINSKIREAARRFRYTVLDFGGSTKELQLLRNFLGRDPSHEAFGNLKMFQVEDAGR